MSVTLKVTNKEYKKEIYQNTCIPTYSVLITFDLTNIQTYANFVRIDINNVIHSLSV